MDQPFFQLSGGRLGSEDHPRTHNDYSLNCKQVAEITKVREDSVMGIASGQYILLSAPGFDGNVVQRREGGPYSFDENRSRLRVYSEGENNDHADPLPAHPVDGGA